MYFDILQINQQVKHMPGKTGPYVGQRDASVEQGLSIWALMTFETGYYFTGDCPGRCGMLSSIDSLKALDLASPSPQDELPWWLRG